MIPFISSSFSVFPLLIVLQLALLIFLVFRHLSGASVPVGTTYLLFSSGTLEGLTMRGARLWTALLVGLIPLGVAIAGFICVRKRRNR